MITTELSEPKYKKHGSTDVFVLQNDKKTKSYISNEMMDRYNQAKGYVEAGRTIKNATRRAGLSSSYFKNISKAKGDNEYISKLVANRTTTKKRTRTTTNTTRKVNAASDNLKVQLEYAGDGTFSLLITDLDGAKLSRVLNALGIQRKSIEL